MTDCARGGSAEHGLLVSRTANQYLATAPTTGTLRGMLSPSRGAGDRPARSVGRRPAVQRVAERGSARRVDPRGAVPAIRDASRSSWWTTAAGTTPGPRWPPASAAEPRVRGLGAGAERRTDRGDDGGVRSRAGPGGGLARRRPAERSPGHPRPARQAGRGVRPGLRLAAAAAGQVPAAQSAVVGRQPDHPAADRRADHRQRLLAQGLPAGPARPDLALRRAAPVHSRAERERRRPDHRDAGAAPCPALRREQVRHLAHGEGAGGPADAEDDHHLPLPAAGRDSARSRCRW